MKKIVIIFSIVVLYVDINAQHVGNPYGFASVPDYGITQLTGGAGGEVVIVNGQADAKILQDALDDDNEPRVIYIYGKVQLPEYTNASESPVSDLTTRMTKVKSNKTIIGIGCDAEIFGSGLSIYSGSGEGVDYEAETTVKNIIIQNITFNGALDDAINIQGGSHHIWIDHCTLTNGTDGLLDYKRGSDYLTVSYCHFHNHKKMSLIGHSTDVRAMDIGHLRATYDHCYWDDYQEEMRSSRHPRIRHGIVHVTNCYFQGVDINSAIDGIVCNEDGRLTVEGCYFQWPKWATQVAYGDDKPGQVKQQNNIIFECKADTDEIWFGMIDWDTLFGDLTGEFPDYPGADPYQYYSYEVSDPSVVPVEVTSNAGACVLDMPGPAEYRIISINVVGEGSVNRAPDKSSFKLGEKVTLTAIPENNWKFIGWSGDTTGTATSVTITINDNKDITANFSESTSLAPVHIIIDEISLTPNPFHSSAILKFRLSQSQKITLNIYDITGKKYQIINNEIYGESENSYTLNRNLLNPGLYFLEIFTDNNRTELIKMFIR